MRTGALYIRVSTDDQVEYSPDAQIRLGLEYAKKNNIIVPKKFIFQDDGISGRKAANRPAFQEMISLAKSEEHPFDAIIVWKFSRFARNQEEAIVYKNLLKKSNIDVVSISEPVPDGFIGELVQRIFEWMDEYYSINLSGEVLRGMTQRAMNGGCNSTPPLGYHMVEGKPVPVPDEADIVKNIFSWYVNERLGCFDIAKRLNALGCKTKRGGKFQNRTVAYILRNEFYIGTIVWNKLDHATRQLKDKSEWIIKDNCHEPIIDRETFKTAQSLINRHSPKRKRPASTYKHWLSGMLVCSNCGQRLVKASTSSAGNVSFQCTGYTHGSCTVSHMISESKLVPVITETLKKVIDGGNVMYRSYAKVNREENQILSTTRKKLNNLEQKELRIKEAYRDGIDTLEEYRQNKEILARERETLEELLKSCEKDNSDNTDNDREILVSNIHSAYDIIANSKSSHVQKHEALASVVEKIVYDKPNSSLNIHFYLDK